MPCKRLTETAHPEVLDAPVEFKSWGGDESETILLRQWSSKTNMNADPAQARARATDADK
jgi:hypothetical protein